MYRILLLSLIMIFVGCAHDNVQNTDGDSNTILVVDYPDDSLVDYISSYRLSVIAVDIIDPVSQSAEITSTANSIDSIEAYIPPGEQRVLTIYFLDDEGSVIFWSKGESDIAEDDNTTLSVSAYQAAARSATRVKILRDNLPWNSDALDVVLSDIGLSLGVGDDQYQVIASDAFDTVSLEAGEDLVIIANDQGQVFYDNYSESQDKIELFISDGGTILWEACDLGWARGSIDSSGLELPMGVETISGYENNNYITSSLYNITAGLDSVLIGNYASHEGFINTPQGALVYTRDSRGLPTLMSFSNGLGWVIITGQPLEYNFQADNSSSPGSLLPRIISHVLGI